MKRFNFKMTAVSGIALILFILLLQHPAQSQGYLHTTGKYIYDANNQEVILRGIGTGNWLLNEGYMMRSADIAGTHTQFRNKLAATIGEANTAAFYERWLDNHFVKRDLDSMKVWGFNSLRVAMHYKWLTLPIEDEPIIGQDTWIESGFVRLDTLLKWCSQNQMYLILDLHAAPGGQGHDANISDYDATKPSLWESSENRRKTTALWRKLAERYADEPWIGGYDLINEPNWDLPNGTLLRSTYIGITNAIREVDNNHIIIIEGNWFANDYTGLMPVWDDNMVLSFHKYWNYNTLESINWMISLRNTHNVPIWLGETGENSNVWFTSLIALCESKKIGWSWWPVKKAGINNIFEVPKSKNYDNLISYWTTGLPVVTPTQAYQAVNQWADNHKVQNCMVKYDVIDAMMRQPFTNETKPFVMARPGDKIFFANYNLGRCGFAYYDMDTANFHLNTGVFTNWNQGWEYRNDGVDIELCTDTVQNNLGYSIGWVEATEWAEYTLQTDSAAAYTVEFRSATASAGAIVRLTVNGVDIMPAHTLPLSGGWQKWKTSSVDNVILPAGTHKIKAVFDRAGSNLNYFSFKNPIAVDQTGFGFLTGHTSDDGKKIFITLNKAITTFTPSLSDFNLKVNSLNADISSFEQNPDVPNGIILTPVIAVKYGDAIKISYTGTAILSGAQILENFSLKTVRNALAFSFTLPGTIQAEDFSFNNGYQLEDCTDTGGGQDLGYANNGDYVDYKITVPSAGQYSLDIRYASIYTSGKVDLRLGDGVTFTTLKSVSFGSTGGWQSWATNNSKIQLPAGSYIFRIYSVAGEYNLNWIKFTFIMGIDDQGSLNNYSVHPNPTSGLFTLTSDALTNRNTEVDILDMQGKVMQSRTIANSQKINENFDIRQLQNGVYFIRIKGMNESRTLKIIKNS
jgi:endoglucanase